MTGVRVCAESAPLSFLVGYTSLLVVHCFHCKCLNIQSDDYSFYMTDGVSTYTRVLYARKGVTQTMLAHVSESGVSDSENCIAIKALRGRAMQSRRAFEVAH